MVYRMLRPQTVFECVSKFVAEMIMAQIMGAE